MRRGKPLSLTFPSEGLDLSHKGRGDGISPDPSALPTEDGSGALSRVLPAEALALSHGERDRSMTSCEVGVLQ
jgi:hypothetical protein